MTLTIGVYSKDDCQQCKATKRALDKRGVAYTESDLADYPHVVAYAEEQGWTTAPIVLVHDVTGQLVAAWSGFRLDKIKEVAHEHQRGDGLTRS